MYTSITGESHCGIETEYMLKVQFQTAFESLRAVVLLSGELQTDKPLTLKLASCFYEIACWNISDIIQFTWHCLHSLHCITSTVGGYILINILVFITPINSNLFSCRTVRLHMYFELVGIFCFMLEIFCVWAVVRKTIVRKASFGGW